MRERLRERVVAKRRLPEKEFSTTAIQTLRAGYL
jgi:hypothetical protein